MRFLLSLSLLAISTSLVGCGDKGPPRKQVFKVTGTLTYEDKPPMSEIQIECHNAAGIDQQLPTVSQTQADPDGTFEISTYEAGDGVPAGEYALTLSWREYNVMMRSYSGPDKLNGRYSDPKTTPIKFSVKDEPIDLGTIELKTE